IRSARYAIAKAGVSQDEANREKLLEALKGVPHAQRDARFVAHLALTIEGITITASGSLEGKITEAPRGNLGFGYDSIFIPKGFEKTLAEMKPSEKNKISHRAIALTELMRK